MMRSAARGSGGANILPESVGIVGDFGSVY